MMHKGTTLYWLCTLSRSLKKFRQRWTYLEKYYFCVFDIATNTENERQVSHQDICKINWTVKQNDIVTGLFKQSSYTTRIITLKKHVRTLNVQNCQTYKKSHHTGETTLSTLIKEKHSFGHCIVCPSSIYGFCLTLWYHQTFLVVPWWEMLFFCTSKLTHTDNHSFMYN